MPETIYKLQPDRTIHLRGFDHFGAAAAIHSASPGGFEVSGVFRDAADFAVVVLYDADNYFEHPRLKYLPNFDFDGLTLRFDLTCSNLMPIDSRKYPTIDWPFLDVVPEVGDPVKVRLSDYAEVVSDPDLPAWGEFQILGDSLDAWDRVTLWYQNLAFDYIVPGKIRTVHEFYAAGAGAQHSIVIADRAYIYVEQAGDGSADVAARLIAMVNGLEGGLPADPDILAAVGDLPYRVMLERKLDTGEGVQISGSGGVLETIYHVKTSTVVQALCNQINSADYAAAETPFSLNASITGPGRLRISTVEGGYDANFITLYSTSKNDRLKTDLPALKLKYGKTQSTLRVTLDFAALGLPRIRKMWITLAPRLADGAEYTAKEWTAEFTNWSVTGPEDTRRLQVAGTGSVRVSSIDSACSWTGNWESIDGFYMDNAARRSLETGDSVSIRYVCLHPHQLWLGTSLGTVASTVSVSLDGNGIAPLSTFLNETEPVISRRMLCADAPAGEHVVTLTNAGGTFIFDYLEAAVPGPVPDPAPQLDDISPALDYSTDHTYKLPPSRIFWSFDQMGYAGPMNEYLGVFWWNERVRDSGAFPERTLEFTGEFAAGDAVWVSISGQLLGKTVFPGESAQTVAAHFKYFINATMAGVWAETDGPRLRVVARSAAEAYSKYTVAGWVAQAPGSTGGVSGGGPMSAGSMGVWIVDPDAENGLNLAAREWHKDFFAQAAMRTRRVTTAISMELVNPPAPFAARFPDGLPVTTDVGFAGLHSTHCAFRSDVLAYQLKVLTQVATLMAEAGLTPSLQCGEFTWWYFSNRNPLNPSGGMGYYDNETAAAAFSALGRPLHIFIDPNEDPQVNSGADALFLRNRLRDHVAALMAGVRSAVPDAQFEVLFPYDVNHPVPRGIHQLGGRLNYFVNLPAEWAYPGGGLDRLKLEMLDFGAWSRDLDLVRLCLQLPAELGWPGEKVGVMTPIFRGGYPWSREVAAAQQQGYVCINLWAFDHVCLYALTLDRESRRASFQG